MFAIALIILVASIVVIRSKKIESVYRGNWLLKLLHQHLIFFAALGAAAYIDGENIVWLTIAMLSTIATSVLWLSRETYNLCGD